MTTRKILSFFNRRTEYGEFVCGYLSLIRVRVRFIAAHPTATSRITVIIMIMVPCFLGAGVPWASAWGENDEVFVKVW